MGGGNTGYFKDTTARSLISGLDASKLTLLEHKATTTGNSLTLNTQLTADKSYLLSIQAPTTATGRRTRLSLICVVQNETNEIYIGSQYFTVTASNRYITITGDNLNYGIEASLIKLF